MMMKKEKTAGKAKTVGTLFTGDDLKKLIFPLIIEQILAVSVGMVDTMMVSSAGYWCVDRHDHRLDRAHYLLCNTFFQRKVENLLSR